MRAMYDFNSNDDIVSIMRNASNSKIDFMKFINWYGYDKKGSEYRSISFLVKNDEQVIDWFRFFNGDSDTILETTEKYKQYKFKKYSMDIHEFLARCAENLKDALEMLFMEECPIWLLNKFEDRLHSNNLALTMVYDKFKTDEWYNSLSRIVRSNL